MSQLFAAFHPFKVVEQSSQTLSLFVTLLQHLFRLVAAMDNVAKYLNLAEFSVSFQEEPRGTKNPNFRGQECCKSLNSISLLFYVGLELEMLETRRQ